MNTTLHLPSPFHLNVSQLRQKYIYMIIKKKKCGNKLAAKTVHPCFFLQYDVEGYCSWRGNFNFYIFLLF